MLAADMAVAVAADAKSGFVFPFYRIQTTV
jgi:hypothetical protein